jgi:hypothetical protein
MLNLQTGSGVHPVSYLTHTVGSFSSGKLGRAWRWPLMPPSSAKVTNEWSHTSTPLQASMLSRGGTLPFIFIFYSLVSNRTDSISLQDHLPKQTQEQRWCSRYRKMSNYIILIVHGCPISVFLFNCFLKTKLWNTFKDSECIQWLSIVCYHYTAEDRRLWYRLSLPTLQKNSVTSTAVHRTRDVDKKEQWSQWRMGTFVMARISLCINISRVTPGPT